MIRESKLKHLDAKHTIESIGCSLLSRASELGEIDAQHLFFELRVLLQRILILDMVGMIDRLQQADDGWLLVLEMDLERELFHVEQFGLGTDPELELDQDSGRIWCAGWVVLLRRDFVSYGGKWFLEFVEQVLELSLEMGAVDESLMGWSARIVDDQFELYSESDSDRKSGGVFYTPASLVGYVLDRSLVPAMDACGGGVNALLALRICDPACGCGYFLTESARRIADRIRSVGGGEQIGAVVRNCVTGCDINPMTAEICRWMLWGLVFERGGTGREFKVEDLRSNILCCDPLVDEFAGSTSGGFDVVVGNPPFLNQLRDGTARDQARLLVLRERRLVGGASYTDDASAFLVLGLRIARDGGRVSMVQPQSVLATKGGAWAREEMIECGALESLWVSNEHVFGDASVYTCVPCVVVGGAQDSIERYSTGRFISHASLDIAWEKLHSLETWSSIAAVTMGVPEIQFQETGFVGDVATATADFRDEYYGLAGNIVEDGHSDGGVALVTTGLVDLGRCWWGKRSTRILKQGWESPRVNALHMQDDARLERWVRGRSVEKVLVATQTKVVEALVDQAGDFVAVTPMISVMPSSDHDVWSIGSAIGSPVCTMHAMRNFGGAAMHADAIKMSAKQVLRLPLPVDADAWRSGADIFQELHQCDHDSYGRVVYEFGLAMCAAYKVSTQEQDKIMGWWLARLGY